MKIKTIIYLMTISIGMLCYSCSEIGSTPYHGDNSQRKLTSLVNPFIGTGGHGHTFPGATLPYGMVQLSPDTRTLEWDACGGYHFSDSSILGFSHTHLSGTGIGDYGDILFMPFTGEAQTTPGTPEDPSTGYRSRFSHDSEVATPGYYEVLLEDDDIKVELTSTVRTGFHRYTFPENQSKGVIIDLAHTIHGHQNPVNEFKVISDTEIVGYKQTKGWAQSHHVYFHAKFSQPFTFQLYKNGVEKVEGPNYSGQNAQAVLMFEDTDQPLMVKVAISPVDYEGATNNLVVENMDWDFDHVKDKASQIWEEQLSKIEVKGGSADEQTIFYTGLYHTSISPNIFSDADGRHRGMDQKIYPSNGQPMYTVFSLWDTFRAFHPLITIIDPKLDEELINSLLTKYDEGGMLPKWELAANYTGTMTGDHGISAIYDAYQKGIKGFDVEKAYQVMVKASQFDTTGILFPSREVQFHLMPMAKYYNQTLGFIPADLENESVSKALEIAYNDWCIAQMALSLGKQADYELYKERADRYHKYFDAKTGFMRGKETNGSWRVPFDPKFSRHRKDDYTEGNAWQWTWFVLHDVPGMIQMMGGKEKFETKLDSLFATGSDIKGEESSMDISGLIGQYAHGNEPSHHITHLYNFIDQSWKTQNLTDSIMGSLYFNDPNGLSGNEDCGQMSAWYILNAMGFYSFCPGASDYSIGRPIFDEVKINLQNGKQFRISVTNNSPENKYIKSAKLDGVDLPRPFFTHEDILKGGVLSFEMDQNPMKWGVDNSQSSTVKASVK